MKQHYKKHTSREARKKQERQIALKKVNSESPGDISRRAHIPLEDVIEYVKAIRHDRRAFFGVSKLSKLNIDSICVDAGLNGPTSDHNEHVLRQVSLLEFASELRRDVIVGALLRCGSNPSRRYSQQLGIWISDMCALSVIRDSPLAYAVWITNNVVTMRINGRKNSVINSDMCYICSQPAVDPLLWPDCGHYCCESCLWIQLHSAKDHNNCFCQICAKTIVNDEVLSVECLSDEIWNERYVAGINVKKESKEKFLTLPIKSVSADEPSFSRHVLRPMRLEEIWCQGLGNIQSNRLFAYEKAAQDGDVNKLRAIIHAGVDVDGLNEYGQSALSIAVFYGHFDVVYELLVNAAADFSIRDNSCATVFTIVTSQIHTHSQDATEMKLYTYQKLMNLLERVLILSDYLNPGKLCSSFFDCKDHGDTSSANTSIEFKSDVFLYENKLFCDIKPLRSSVQRVELKPLIDWFVGSIPLKGIAESTFPLLAQVCPHPGSGSFYVDGLLDDYFLDKLVELHTQLPVAPATKESCSERSYLFDSEGWVTAQLNSALRCVSQIVLAYNFSSDGVSWIDNKRLNRDFISVLPNMRYLHYSEAGGKLAPHVDLMRVDPISKLESTHTFVLYLTNCAAGGETILLDRLAPPPASQRLHSCSKDQFEGRIPLSIVAPKRGRLLLFPHLCPHMGNTVESPPKLLLRGEVIMNRSTSDNDFIDH